jgi:hypothetical protein
MMSVAENRAPSGLSLLQHPKPGSIPLDRTPSRIHEMYQPLRADCLPLDTDGRYRRCSQGNQYRSQLQLKRVRSGAFKARKALPEDILEAYAKLYGQRWEAIFWAPAGTHPDRAKFLHAEWLVAVERRVMALRFGEHGEPVGWLQTPQRTPLVSPTEGPATQAAERPKPAERTQDRPPERPAITRALDLFEAYCLDTRPAAWTINRWRAVFTTLDTVSNWHARGWDAQQWLDGLKTEDRSPRAVRDVWLSAARTVSG